jgi:hypothetical protein
MPPPVVMPFFGGLKMGSLTKKMKMIRKRKVRTGGKGRKKLLRSGTTPRFPIHLEEEPDAVVPMPPGSHPAEK